MKKTVLVLSLILSASFAHANETSSPPDRADDCEAIAASKARDLAQLTFGSIIENGEDVRVVMTSHHDRKGRHPSYTIEVRNRTRHQTGVFDIDMTRSHGACELNSILLVELKSH